MPALDWRLAQIRMPSRMVGSKTDVYEGGWRNFLAVRGPGVPRGAVSTALTGIADLAPTLVALAGGTSTQHGAFDGTSLASVLVGDNSSAEQLDGRFVITLSPECYGPDLVPQLGKDRCGLGRGCVHDQCGAVVAGLGGMVLPEGRTAAARGGGGVKRCWFVWDAIIIACQTHWALRSELHRRTFRGRRRLWSTLAGWTAWGCHHPTLPRHSIMFAAAHPLIPPLSQCTTAGGRSSRSRCWTTGPAAWTARALSAALV